MSQLPTLSHNGEILELNLNLLDTLEKIREELKLPKIEAALLKLRTYLDGPGGNDETLDRIIGEDGPLLKKKLDKLLDVFARVSGSQSFAILNTLDELSAQEVKSYSLDTSRNASRTLPDGNITFSASGNAELLVELEVRKATALSTEEKLSIPEHDAVLSASLSGSVGVKGNFSAPIGAGKLQIGGGVSAGAKLQFHYQYPGRTTALEALAVSAKDLTNPWDLDSVFAALEPVNGSQCTGFRAIDFEANGELSLAAAAAWGWSRTSNTTVQNKPVATKVTAELRANISWTRAGNFLFRLEKDAEGGLVVSVKRVDQSTLAGGVSLSTEIGISGLDAVLADNLEPFLTQLADADGRLGKFVEEWATPGDVLLTEISEQLLDAMGQQDLSKVLIRMLVGQEPADALPSVVRDLLVKEMEAALKEYLPVLVDPNQAASAVARRVARRFDLDNSLSAALESALNDALKPKLSDLSSKLETAINNLYTQQSPKMLEAIANAIGNGADEIKKLKDSMNKSATEFMPEVKKLLSEIKKLKSRLESAIALSAKIDIAARLGWSVQRNTSDTVDYKLRFAPFTDLDGPNKQLAHSVFRALMTGKLAGAAAALQQAIDNNVVALLDCHMRSTGSLEKVSTFGIRIFDFELSSTRRRLADVDAWTDAGGIVRVAARSMVSSEVSWFGEKKAVQLNVNFANTKGHGEHSLDLQIHIQDKKLEVEELEGYLNSLNTLGTQAPLLSQDALWQAPRYLANIGAGKAELTFARCLNAAQLNQALTAASTTIEDRAAQYLFEAYVKPRDRAYLDTVLRDLHTGYKREAGPATGLAALFDKFGGNNGASIQDRLNKRSSRELYSELLATLNGRTMTQMSYFQEALDAVKIPLKGLREAISILHTLADKASQNVSVQSHRDSLLELESDLANALSRCVTATGQDRLTWKTVALLRLLADAAGHNSPLYLAIVSERDKGLRIFV